MHERITCWKFMFLFEWTLKKELESEQYWIRKHYFLENEFGI